MEVGAGLIGMVKKNTKKFCKNTIEKLTNYWPGGSYLVLGSKPMVPRDRTHIAIGYKYNVWKFLSFIVTDNAGNTKTGILYLYKYPDQFTNVAIRPVAIDENYQVVTLILKNMVIYPSVWRIMHYSCYPQFLQLFYIHMH